MKKYLLVALLVTFAASLSFAQTVLYSQTFNGNLGNCTVINHTTSTAKWVHSGYGFNDPTYGTIYFNSPSYSNGSALVLSDGVSTAVNTDLITPSVNCTGHPYVALKFNQLFFAYQNNVVGQVLVSTDSTNWTLVFDAMQDFINRGAAILDPQEVDLDLSALAGNQPKVWVKFNYQATNDRWYAVDDISLVTLPANDVAVDTVLIPNYVGISNGSVTIQTTIENLGGAALNSVQLSYKIGNGAPVTQTFGTLGMSPFTTSTLQFNTPANFDSVAAYTVTVSASSPNGGVDGNTANDVASRKIVGISQIPNRNVLLEEFSTAICGYCPGGLTLIEQIMATIDSTFVIPVSIHAGFGTDAMTTTEADTLASDLDLQGAPTAAVNRELYYGASGPYYGNQGLTIKLDDIGYPNNLQPAVEAEYGVVSPVGITASNSYNPQTREVSVTVNSTFYGPATGDFRMNCYVIEDSVVGSGAGYDQHSYYWSSPAANVNPWYHVGSYSASNGYATIRGYVHHHVDRKLMNGTWGEASGTGNIPHTPTPGTTYSQTFTYTLPSTIRSKFVTLVPFVSQYNSSFRNSEYNMVWNALAMPLNTATGINEATVAHSDNIVLYPNPAQNMVTLAYTLDNDAKLSFEVYNILGEMVSSEGQTNFDKGSYTTGINTAPFANGIYFVTVKDDAKIIQTLKFVIAK